MTTRTSHDIALGDQLLSAALAFEDGADTLMSEFLAHPEFDGSDLVPLLRQTIEEIGLTYGLDPYLIKIAWDVLVRHQTQSSRALLLGGVGDDQVAQFYRICRARVDEIAQADENRRLRRHWESARRSKWSAIDEEDDDHPDGVFDPHEDYEDYEER